MVEEGEGDRAMKAGAAADSEGVATDFEELPSMLYWLVSYPKSGNTWLKLMIHEYFRGKDNAPIRASDSAPIWMQLVSPVPLSRLNYHMQAALRPAAMANLSAAHFGRRVLVKSHHGCYDLSDVPLFGPAWGRKVLLIVRDPRDILPSLAHHMGYTLDEAFETMCRSFATLERDDGGLNHIMGTWSQHVSSWINQSLLPVRIIQYEALHADTEGVLRDALRWLDEPDYEIDDEAIERAVERTNFDVLRSREEEEGGYHEQSRHQDRFFRRGEIGSHKDEVPAELVARIEEEHGKMMRVMGYLPSEETS